MREILQFLREQHIPAAIASSTRRAAVRQQITLFGLQDFFCKIIGGDMVQQSKPHPEIYQTACAAMDVPPACAYAVEDSYNGIRAASRAGMHPIMIPDLLPPTPEMEQLAEQIFPDMAAFQAFLKASQKK